MNGLYTTTSVESAEDRVLIYSLTLELKPSSAWSATGFGVCDLRSAAQRFMINRRLCRTIDSETFPSNETFETDIFFLNSGHNNAQSPPPLTGGAMSRLFYSSGWIIGTIIGTIISPCRRQRKSVANHEILCSIRHTAEKNGAIS